MLCQLSFDFLLHGIPFSIPSLSVCVSLDLRCVSCRRHIYWSCFCIHSATLCLFIGAFSPFTFKVILHVYTLIAILLISKRRWFMFLSSFVLFSCGLMTVFSVMFGFLFLFCLCIYYRFLVCVYHEVLGCHLPGCWR